MNPKLESVNKISQGFYLSNKDVSFEHLISLIFCILYPLGVSAQSFIHAFTLTHSVFNVQIATPKVGKSSFQIHPNPQFRLNLKQFPKIDKHREGVIQYIIVSSGDY